MTALDATLPGRLVGHAQQRGAAVALREKRLGLWEEVSWAEYHRRVAATGRALWELGVRPGDSVGVLSDNRTEWLYADLGAQGIGARTVGIYQTNPPSEVAWTLEHSGCVVLFCEDQEQVDKAVAVAHDTPTVRRVVIFDPRGTSAYQDPRLESWSDFLATGERLLGADTAWFDERVHALDPDSPSMVVYTSGTTGTPKGALLSSRNALHASQDLVPALQATERDLVLSYLPLCHVAEKIFSLFLPLTCGAVVHFGESIETIQSDLREVSPTVFLGVPRIWEKMHASVTLRMRDASFLKRRLFDFFLARCRPIRDPERTAPLTLGERLTWAAADLLVFRALQERLGLRRCRIPISGAAPVSEELLRWFHAIGVPVMEGFGQTECGGVSHTNLPGRVRIGTVGPVIPGLECRIADDGEVLLRGHSVFLGYLHDDDATARTIDPDGWLHTGDIGTLDDDGSLRITGRKKEIIITAGGKNLSPERIENALKSSPYIKEAVALGDGQRFVAALIQADRDSVADFAMRREVAFTDYADLVARPEVRKLIEQEVNAGNEQLARVEQVRAFRLLPRELNQDDGELTATQKVRRRAVAARYEAMIAEIYGG